MVQTDVVEAALLRRYAQRVRDFLEHLGRGVTDADHTRSGFRSQRLGNQTSGVGEVDDPGVGRALHHLPRIVQQRWNGAHRHGEAARPDRLLSDEPQVERRPFVADARLHATGTDAGDDKRRAVDRRRRRGVRGHSRRPRAPPRQPGDHRQAILIRIVERELVDAERCTGESIHQQRHAHTGATDHRNLHRMFQTPGFRL